MSELAVPATGMTAQKMRVRQIANDVANMTTDAYNRTRLIFQDHIYQDFSGVGTATSAEGTINATGIQIGLGVQAAGVVRNIEQGDIQQTNNPLDIMIQGKGYLQVILPNGETAYTRDGGIVPTAEGILATIDGYRFVPDITIPVDTEFITINESGEVFAKIAGQIAPQLLGQFELATFPNEAGLRGLGKNLWQTTPASGEPVNGLPNSNGFGSILSGAKEASNVNVVTAITELIEAEQAHQMNTRAFDVASELKKPLPNLGR